MGFFFSGISLKMTHICVRIRNKKKSNERIYAYNEIHKNSKYVISFDLCAVR